jgi:hypothetical protein
VIETLSQSVRVDDVADVVMTTIEQDGDSGNYVREFRIFGQAASEGGTLPLIYTLRVESLTEAALQVTTPTLQV